MIISRRRDIGDMIIYQYPFQYIFCFSPADILAAHHVNSFIDIPSLMLSLQSPELHLDLHRGRVLFSDLNVTCIHTFSSSFSPFFSMPFISACLCFCTLIPIEAWFHSLLFWIFCEKLLRNLGIFILKN